MSPHDQKELIAGYMKLSRYDESYPLNHRGYQEKWLTIPVTHEEWATYKDMPPGTYVQHQGEQWMFMGTI